MARKKDLPGRVRKELHDLHNLGLRFLDDTQSNIGASLESLGQYRGGRGLADLTQKIKKLQRLRDDLIVHLRRQGMSVADLVKITKLSRQRIYQITGKAALPRKSKLALPDRSGPGQG